MCGNNASGAQRCGYISIVCYTYPKLALLLHKTVPINFPIATTVVEILVPSLFLSAVCAYATRHEPHIPEFSFNFLTRSPFGGFVV